MAKTRLCLCLRVFDILRRSPCVSARRTISSGFPLKYSERWHKIKGWSYVNQAMIETCAGKPSVKVTPFQMLNAGKNSDGSHLIIPFCHCLFSYAQMTSERGKNTKPIRVQDKGQKNVQFLQKELVTRIAHRLVAFHSLPYIVAVNPDISDTYELYIRAFNILSQHPKVTDLKSERKYSKMVKSLLDDHRHVVTSLARGFKDCKFQVAYKTIHSFLDNTLKSRLGIRMLAEQHIALREEKENFVGIIATDLSLKTVIERSADFVRQVCEHHYNVCPGILINGHTEASFPYFPAPLEYILQELLKNAMRSTVEFHSGKSSLPSVVITISSNETNFTIRISDQGGGIIDDICAEIFNYSFTTFKKETANSNALAEYSTTMNSPETIGSMAGFGFGLPTSRAYAEFLGGSVHLQTMTGLGTDVYIKLKKIDGDKGDIRL